MSNPFHTTNQEQNLINNINMLNNPMSQLQQINPQIYQMIMNGVNPQQLFYQLCNQRNINPQTILNSLNHR